MHTEEKDYLSILSGLGRECLGAIKIISESENAITPEYQELSDLEVKRLAQEGATESAELVTKAHLSLTGASGKVGLYYDESRGKWYLPIGDAPSTHIVKQRIRFAPAYDIVSTVIYESCTENMALSIDGIYNINDITRDSFEKEAAHIGMGK